jgi:hypothetical protein
VTGFESSLQVKDSAKLSREARAAIRSVFTKAGALRIDMHDKLAALVALHKILTGKDDLPSQSLTINQTNLGKVDALDAARKVAFLLAAARAQALPGPILDAVPAPISREADMTTAD